MHRSRHARPAVQMLALLQRDGRFVDFLEEDVSSYPDGQLGAAVRSIHNSCRQVLDRYIKLEPVFSSERTIQSPCRWASIRQPSN